MGRKSEVQRSLLEKLMGPEAMGTANVDLHFWDDKVCRNFICGTCPHDLFSNTKVDLGVCPKSHTSRLKDEYKAALTKGDKYPPFEAEYEDNIRSFMADIDRKIAANKRRIDVTPEETAKFTNLMRDISDVEAALEAAMKEVERLGEDGLIEESLAELQKAEALKQEKAGRERELQILSDSAGASGHQKLRVCDVCGAYLSILDSDRRLADHFGGRMHLGYLRLREIITEFDERRARGEDPRTLMAQGIGSRIPTSAINGAPAGNGSGPANGYGPPGPDYNGGGGGYGPRGGAPPGAGGYGAPPPRGYAPGPPAGRYGPPGGGGGGYGGYDGRDRDRDRDRDPRDRDRDRPRDSSDRGDRDRDRDRERERERDRSERRRGGDDRGYDRRSRSPDSRDRRERRDR